MFLEHFKNVNGRKSDTPKIMNFRESDTGVTTILERPSAIGCKYSSVLNQRFECNPASLWKKITYGRERFSFKLRFFSMENNTNTEHQIKKGD